MDVYINYLNILYNEVELANVCLLENCQIPIYIYKKVCLKLTFCFLFENCLTCNGWGAYFYVFSCNSSNYITIKCNVLVCTKRFLVSEFLYEK